MRVLVTGADYVWGYLTAEAVLARKRPHEFRRWK